MAKPFYRSKTIWINSLVFLLSAVIYVTEGVQAGDFVAWTEIDADLIAMLLAAANFALRWITSQPLARPGR